MKPTDKRNSKKNLERLAWYLDSSIRIPGMNARFGVDALYHLAIGLPESRRP